MATGVKETVGDATEIKATVGDCNSVRWQLKLRKQWEMETEIN